MIERYLTLVYRYLRELLFQFLPPEWQAAYCVVEGVAKHCWRLRMRFLAAGIFAPMAAFAVLRVIVWLGGPIPETPAVINGLVWMVGFQMTCAILAFIEMAYNDSCFGKPSNA